MKPLTLGNVIDQTLASHTWEMVNTPGQTLSMTIGFLRKPPQEIPLAERIDKMEKEHGCKTLLRSYQGMNFLLKLEEKAFVPMMLTEAEYLRYRPAANSPL